MREICQCGCFKECHLPHQLDEHGGECSHCKDCTIYTWRDFLWETKEAKDKFASPKEEAR